MNHAILKNLVFLNKYVQTQSLMSKESQKSKLDSLNILEQNAIEKYKLGSVEYHKGPIEIFLKKKRIPITKERLQHINPKYAKEIDDLELDNSLLDNPRSLEV